MRADAAVKTVQGPADFTVGFVLQALVSQGLLVPEHAREIHARESIARARVLKAIGDPREAARYDVSPVEIVASFNLAVGGGRGALDQDRVTEAAAKAAGIAYRKIDPLKLDMNLATRSVSRPYAQRHVLLPLEKLPDGTLVVAVANPFDHELFANLCNLTGTRVQPVLAAKQDILRCVAEIWGFQSTLARAADDFQPAAGQGPKFEKLGWASG